MARTLSRTKNRSDKVPGFSMLIHEYFQSKEYSELSPPAVKLLVDLYCQYRGGNNGDLCATLSVMRKVSWNSNDQLQKALTELLATGWLVIARQGGRRMPTLYALTFLAINNTGKLDCHVKASPNKLHLWKMTNRAAIALNESTDRLWKKIMRAETSSCRTAVFRMPPSGSKPAATMLH
jgi:hypothetical protein